MQIRLSTLRKLIREELTFKAVMSEAMDDDTAAYEKIMAMITAALGDSPETKKIGAELGQSMGVPQQIQMQSIAQKGAQPTAPPEDTIQMKSIAQRPPGGMKNPGPPGKAGRVGNPGG